MSDLDKIRALLEHVAEVMITSHVTPDGDSIGSCVGLALGLTQLGKKVRCVQDEAIPDLFHFMNYLPFYRPQDLEYFPQVVICLDSTGLDRLGEALKSELIRPGHQLVNIDHHLSNEMFGVYNYIDSQAASTGEIVLKLLLALGVRITAEIATALYTAIVTDTGSFQYENTSSQVLRQSAFLLDRGADLPAIREHIWESQPLESLLVLQRVLASLQLTTCGKIAWVSLTLADLEAIGAKVEHCEGIVNYPRSINGVKVALSFRESEPGVVKVGLRSKTEVDVDSLARQFGGGGHLRAAGCVIRSGLPEAVSMVVEAAKTVVAQAQ